VVTGEYEKRDWMVEFGFCEEAIITEADGEL
jgi:hypothetical protein